MGCKSFTGLRNPAGPGAGHGMGENIAAPNSSLYEMFVILSVSSLKVFWGGLGFNGKSGKTTIFKRRFY